MSYTVITEQSIDDLISEVNEFIRKGYKPVGGIAILHKGENYKVFYQSMTKQ